MRKKSHILLARYLADQMETATELQAHRKAFFLGNILPDIKPSFLTTKHEFEGTFDAVGEKIRALTIDCDLYQRNERVYWRRLGEVIHYIADYFTFPHNRLYTGSLLEHGKYEKELKNYLKSYLANGQAWIYAREDVPFQNLSELLEYIKENHEAYLKSEHNIKEDIAFILRICYQVVQGIFHLLMRKSQRYELQMQFS